MKDFFTQLLDGFLLSFGEDGSRRGNRSKLGEIIVRCLSLLGREWGDVCRNEVNRCVDLSLKVDGWSPGRFGGSCHSVVFSLSSVQKKANSLELRIPHLSRKTLSVTCVINAFTPPMAVDRSLNRSSLFSHEICPARAQRRKAETLAGSQANTSHAHLDRDDWRETLWNI